jgi:hypothetical protein
MAKCASLQQDDLFTCKTIHQLVETHTGKELLKSAANHVKEPGRNSALDILAGRRGAKTIKAATTRAEKAAESLLGDGIYSEDLRAYAYAAWAHAGLPRRDLRDPTQRWTVSTDYATLTVTPGTRRLTEGGEATPIGVPFGSYARLVLLDWQSEAIRRSSRQIHIGRSMSDALKRMGLPHGSEAMRMLQEQIERLAVCTVVGWVALKAQLGGGATLMKNFKPHFRPSFLAAHAVYREADVELTDEGTILRPSPPPMPRRRLIAGG